MQIPPILNKMPGNQNPLILTNIVKFELLWPHNIYVKFSHLDLFIN